MRHCIEANLVGHDSHGIIQIPGYIDRIRAGHIVPGAKWEIVQESPTTTVVDGNWGFGYVANEADDEADDREGAYRRCGGEHASAAPGSCRAAGGVFADGGRERG